ncbi:MAG TPA: hypothetical protein VF824_09690 [Thermoanaerobaculia bacterium]|jgi:hypothetical protein
MQSEQQDPRNEERRNASDDRRITFDGDTTWALPLDDPDATWPLVERLGR